MNIGIYIHGCISDCDVDWSIPTDVHTFPCYEFEDASSQSMMADGSTIVTVQGRLREHSKIWLSDLKASEFVKQIAQFAWVSHPLSCLACSRFSF